MFDTKDISSLRFIEKIKILYERSDDPHNIYTPIELCQEIISKIPSLDGKILVIANLEFVYTLYREGVPAQNIYFATPCPLKFDAARSLLDKNNVFKYNNVITTEDVNNMKFDVVIGNPPYQPPKNENTKILWPSFLENAFKLSKIGGYVALITPRTWTTNALYEKCFLTHNPIHINIDECAKYFPKIGSTFSYFILQNCDAKKQKFNINTKEGSTTLTALPSFGLGNATPLGLSILQKTIGSTTDYFKMITSSGYNTMKFSKKDPSVSWKKTEEHRYPVLHKILKKEGPVFFYSNFLDKTTYNVPRVVLNIWVNNYRDMTVETELLTCEQFRHFPTNTIQEAQVLREILLSKLYTYIAFSLVSGGSFTNKSLSKFPKVDLTRSWTDEELYEHFNLTNEEIELIEETIK